MHILLTGGTGFIGRRLSELLLARGDEVTVLTRTPGSSPPGLRATRLVGWDPQSGPPHAELFSSVSAVVNLLGESIAKGRWTPEKKRRIRDSRILGTRHLVDGIRAASPRPKTLVSGSAIGFYGPRNDELLDEGVPGGSDFLAELCRDWEAEAARAEHSGVRVVLLRTGVVFGAGGGALGAMLPPFRLGLGGPVGSGRQWMSWIHIDDLCGLVIHALDSPDLHGPLNATAPQPVPNRELAKALGRVLGRPALLPAPAFALKLLLGEMAEALLLKGQRVVPSRARASGYRFRYADLDSALGEVLRPRT